MELEFLANKLDAIPLIADWYQNEWGHLDKGNSKAVFEAKLQAYLNIDKVPLMVLAINENEVIGVAQLKRREMDIYPEKEYWLGGVYVSKHHRGNKTAEKIIRKIMGIAQTLHISQLYLQTENLNGGLYRRLGWQPLERVNYKGIHVLVMVNNI